MSVIIPPELRRDRDHRNITDDMAGQLGDMYAVASLLGAVDTDDVGDEQVNATGSLLQSMIDKAKEISHEHYTLWLEELEERRKELAESKKD
ncbi:MAG: hypothetical protein IH898_10810 [Planctomycetes bacterium]|nr:hypothetical protein [Planctomycetota bacterium]